MKIILAVFSLSSAAFMERIGRKLAASGHIVTLIYMGDDREEFFRRAGRPSNGISAKTRHDYPLPGLTDRIRTGASRLLRTSPDTDRQRQARRLLDRNSRLAAAWKDYLTQSQDHFSHCLKILAMEKADAVLCTEDGVSADLVFLTAARKLSIPVLDCPFGNGTKEELIQDMAVRETRGDLVTYPATGDENEDEIRSFLAPWFCPSGRWPDVLMYPAGLLLTWESLGIHLPQPWSLHGGNSDCLCLESEKAVAQYGREGVRRDKMVITGSPYCDIMYDQLADSGTARNALLKGRKINPERTSVLISWPPSYHESRPGKCEFSSYEEMTRRCFMDLAALPHTDIVLSIHPSAPPGVRETARDCGIRVNDGFIIELIPEHDIFLTYYSSTIRWALAAGKPVVNYDAYKLSLPAYDHVESFINEARWPEALGSISRLCADDDFYRKTADGICAVSKEWGVIDGKAVANIDRILRDQTPRV